MKILYYFAEEDSYMYKWQRFHFFDELSRHNIEIEVFNPICYTQEEEFDCFKNYLNKNHNFDMFMTCHGDDVISKRHTDLIKEYGIPSLLICFDNLHEPFQHKYIAKEFDVVWLTSKETEYLFKKWGCKNIVFQTYAANPFSFKPFDNIVTDTGSVCFIGTPYGTRSVKINTLTENNLPVDLYFSGTKPSSESKEMVIKGWLNNKSTLGLILPYLSFPIGRKVLLSAFANRLFSKSAILNDNEYLHVYPSVSFENMIRIYNATALSLNITELRNTYILKKPIHKMHLRTFEIPMSGGLEICSYTPELSEYFEDGKEIILYKSIDEYIDKAKFYTDSKNTLVVDELKRNARKRAETEHTWFKRFSLIFNNLNLKY